MTNRWNDIQDDEFRVIGKRTTTPNEQESTRPRRSIGVAIVSAILILAIGILAILKWPKVVPEVEPEGVFEELQEALPQNTQAGWFGHPTALSYTERIDTVINDVQLSIYIPHNAVPKLNVGIPDQNDAHIILAAQAADIRADNLEILGSFVLEGEVLARGKSKKGYCAIIDGELTIGVGDNPAIYEEAIESKGYFFRQYPLVDNGVLVENAPKGKSLRKALCERQGELFIVVSESDESFHDFAQALVDLGVNNAIYLVGSHRSNGWFRNEVQCIIPFSNGITTNSYSHENYIVWSFQ